MGVILIRYGGSAGELQHLLPNLNVLVAVSKGTWAINLRSNKSLQSLMGEGQLMQVV